MSFDCFPRLRDEMKARKASRFCTSPWEYPFSLRGLVSLLLLAFLLPSCAIFKSKSARSAHKIEREVVGSPVFSKAFTGFTLLDPATGKTLADFNGERYFTPASNTKILTLATCLEMLGDSVPGMQIIQMEKATVLRGTGDPTFLNPLFNAWQVIYQKIRADTLRIRLVIARPLKDSGLGPGWAWDDAREPYSAERSDLPIFGGLINIYNNIDSTKRSVAPRLLHSLFIDKKVRVKMPFGLLPNQGYFWPEHFKNDTLKTPIVNAASISRLLLADTTASGFEQWSNEATQREFEKVKNWRTLYSTPLDTVLRRMMHQSDNFIAEQMLLVCAGVKFDLLKQDTMIKWMLDSTQNSLPQRPKWVDGSGLSRYNLMTPQSIAQVLLKLWKEQPRERLFSLFPAGGVSGTIADMYAGKDNKPYVFAKTGGMGGVQCLSGYVVCKSGKVLVFSFMHNNFVGSSKAWKVEMQRILEQIRDRF